MTMQVIVLILKLKNKQKEKELSFDREKVQERDSIVMLLYVCSGD